MQFTDLRQQHDAAELGMWVFLATEVLFFGGLILAYCVYRIGDPARLCRGGAAHQDRHRDREYRGAADVELSGGLGGDGCAARTQARLAGVLLWVRRCSV